MDVDTDTTLQTSTESSDEETSEAETMDGLMDSSSSESSEDEVLCPIGEKDCMEIISKYSDIVFKKHFRMCRENVHNLIGKYSLSDLARSNTQGRPEMEVYMFLWYVGDKITFQKLGNIFGTAKSTAWSAVRRVSHWLISIGHEYVKWPKGPDAENVSTKFEMKCGIPGVIGAIDCTRVGIKAPTTNKTDYFDRNRNYSLVVQAVVDTDKRFLSIFAGEPGSLNDTSVLRRSELYRDAFENQLNYFPNNSVLLGNSAYQSTKWIITPFQNNGTLSENQINFNMLHATGLIVVESTFALLETRFPRFTFFSEQTDLTEVVNLIVAICILYNICITLNENEIEVREDSDSDDNYGIEESVTNGSLDRRQELFEQLVKTGVIH